MPSFAPNWWDYDASVHPWRLVCWTSLQVHFARGEQIAAELCRETDTRRVGTLFRKAAGEEPAIGFMLERNVASVGGIHVAGDRDRHRPERLNSHSMHYERA